MKVSRGVQLGSWYRASISVRGMRIVAATRPASVVLPEPAVPATRIRWGTEGRSSWAVSTSSSLPGAGQRPHTPSDVARLSQSSPQSDNDLLVLRPDLALTAQTPRT